MPSKPSFQGVASVHSDRSGLYFELVKHFAEKRLAREQSRGDLEVSLELKR